MRIGEHTIGVRRMVEVTDGTNEVQRVNTAAGTSGGTFVLVIDGQSTVPIPWNGPSSAVQAALEAHPSIGAGNVSVSPTGPIPQDFLVAFAGDLGSTDLTQMAVNGAGLTGAGAGAWITTETQGVAASSDQFGRPAMQAVNVKVDGCLVVPSSRAQDTDEPVGRALPRITGLELYCPPGTDLLPSDVVVFPIESESGAGPDLVLSGPVYQVSGEVGRWEESVEARLVRAS